MKSLFLFFYILKCDVVKKEEPEEKQPVIVTKNEARFSLDKQDKKSGGSNGVWQRIKGLSTKTIIISIVILIALIISVFFIVRKMFVAKAEKVEENDAEKVEEIAQAEEDKNDVPNAAPKVVKADEVLPNALPTHDIVEENNNLLVQEDEKEKEKKLEIENLKHKLVLNEAEARNQIEKEMKDGFSSILDILNQEVQEKISNITSEIDKTKLEIDEIKKKMKGKMLTITNVDFSGLKDKLIELNEFKNFLIQLQTTKRVIDFETDLFKAIAKKEINFWRNEIKTAVEFEKNQLVVLANDVVLQNLINEFLKKIYGARQFVFTYSLDESKKQEAILFFQSLGDFKYIDGLSTQDGHVLSNQPVCLMISDVAKKISQENCNVFLLFLASDIREKESLQEYENYLLKSLNTRIQFDETKWWYDREKHETSEKNRLNNCELRMQKNKEILGSLDLHQLCVDIIFAVSDLVGNGKVSQVREKRIEIRF